MMDIEIWVSGLEHHDKFKDAVLRNNSMYSPVQSQFLMTYGHPTKILDSSAGIMRHTTNGYIYTLPLRTMARGRATNTMQTHIHVSPGYPMKL